MKEWMIKTATILFDDSKNDLRALPKTVRLQLLTVLSFMWSTAFTLYFFGLMRPDIWGSLVIGHIAVIFAMYYTFKQFHNAILSLNYFYLNRRADSFISAGHLEMQSKGNYYEPNYPKDGPPNKKAIQSKWII